MCIKNGTLLKILIFTYGKQQHIPESFICHPLPRL